MKTPRGSEGLAQPDVLEACVRSRVVILVYKALGDALAQPATAH